MTQTTNPAHAVVAPASTTPPADTAVITTESVEEIPSDVQNFRRGLFGTEGTLLFVVRFQGGKHPGFAVQSADKEWFRSVAKRDCDDWSDVLDRLIAVAGRKHSESANIPIEKLDFAWGEAPEKQNQAFQPKPFENAALLTKLNVFRPAPAPVAPVAKSSKKK